MRNRHYKHLGKEIGQAMRNAIRSGNFEDIGRVVGVAVQEVTDNINEVFCNLKKAVRDPHHSTVQDRSQNSVFSTSQQETQSVYRASTVHSAFRRRMPGSISGFVYSIIGACLGIPLLIADIVVFIVGFARYMPLSAMNVTSSILLPFTIGSFGLMVHGINLRHRARRFACYRDAMGGAAFCMVARLADTTGVTQKRAKKDLKKMITCGACPQGHLDRSETCFVVDNQTYFEFLEAEKAYDARTEAARDEEQKRQADPKEAELETVKNEGNGYLQQIRAVNDALPGKVISEKLNRLENVTALIFECVRQHPEKLPDIRRFIRYYMPTTLKLVKAYEEFEVQPVQGENITKAKEEIERVLDTINIAFENLLDTLFADDALDISTDISTLETMLKQEGLTGSDFTKAPDDSKIS